MKKISKYTILSRSWRALAWGVLTPIVLFALCMVLIYLPPVQKWAVDKAAESLSEEMGMEVTVERVRLKFPLDLSVGGVLAVQEGDTVLGAEELCLSLQPRPLLEKKLNVDDIVLRGAKVNTRNLIDEVIITGRIDELKAYTHGVNLNETLVTVNDLLIDGGDILLTIPDTVPPDTTEGKPNTWKIDLQNVELHKFRYAMLRPSQIDTYFENATCRAFIDLENKEYTVGNLRAQGAKARVDEAVDMREASLRSDSIRFASPLDLYVRINQLEGKERCGINFKKVEGVVTMDTLDLYIDDLNILTDDSKLNVNMKMALNTWADENPGIMQLGLNSMMGKSDVLCITKYVDRFMPKGSNLDAVRDLTNQFVKAKPVPLKTTVVGNLDNLAFNDIHTNFEGIGKLEGSARLRRNVVDADIRGALLGGDALAKGQYNIDDETYDVDVNLKDFDVNKYVELPERTVVTGQIHAKGKGFEPYVPSTQIDATANIVKGHYGKIDLSSINADLSLKRSKMYLDLKCDNDQIATAFALEGVLRKGQADGTLNIDLAHADLRAMGLLGESCVIGTRGVVDFKSNLDNIFYVKSNVDGLDITQNGKKIHTDDFKLDAETTRKNTSLCLMSGDLDLDFQSPYNLFDLMKRVDKLDKVAKRQADKREVDIESLTKYMPVASLKAKAGRWNPLSDVLQTRNVRFGEFYADLNASPESGLTGNAHVYAMKYDTIRIDTAYIDIRQDYDRVVFTSGVKSGNQPFFPAFFASIDGYYTPVEGDVHVQFYDDKGKQGLDLGAHLTDQDSMTHVRFYPDVPVIGFHRYSLDEESYVDFYKGEKHPIVGYVNLNGIDSKSMISLTGLDLEGEQGALVEMSKFNLGEFCKLIPFMPNIEGLLDVDAAYHEEDGRLWVDGMVDVGGLVYEGTSVGNVGSMFTYEPEGEGFSVHKVEGDISFEGYDVVSLEGKYDAKGNGYLDADLQLKDIPLKQLSPFIPDHLVALDGKLGGEMSVKGPTDRLQFDGYAVTKDVYVASPYYSINMRVEDDTLRVDNSRLALDSLRLYGAGDTPALLNGYIDVANMDKPLLSLQLTGRGVQLIDSKQTAKSLLFGNAFGDVFARVTSDGSGLTVRGYVNVFPQTNLTYIMSDAVISQGDRLDDIVTFVDFSLPADSNIVKEEMAGVMGVDMRMTLNIQEGTRLRVDISADKQSYVTVRGGGSLIMTYSADGMLNAQGKLTVSEGEMKYALPIIPLKTFKIQNGSSVEFSGDIMNPTLDITAIQRTKAQVGTSGGASQSVAFDVGMVVSKTLSDMGLAFTLSAPNNQQVMEELKQYTDDEKNKLAVALLATGMYLSDNNSSAITANNALSSFLQSQINSIAGRALGSFVDVSLGMDEHTYDDGTRSNDYSFKFSKRFFSDRLNVVIGGSVSDNEAVNQNTSIGSFIDDVSLEWRLDQSATRYVTLFHRKDYENPVEGVLEKNGAGIVLRKKLNSMSDIMFWKKKKDEK